MAALDRVMERLGTDVENSELFISDVLPEGSGVPAFGLTANDWLARISKLLFLIDEIKNTQVKNVPFFLFFSLKTVLLGLLKKQHCI